MALYCQKHEPRAYDTNIDKFKISLSNTNQHVKSVSDDVVLCVDDIIIIGSVVIEVVYVDDDHHRD